MITYLSNPNLVIQDLNNITDEINNKLKTLNLDINKFWNNFNDFIKDIDLSKIKVKSSYLIKVADNYILQHMEELKPVYLDYTFDHIYKTELKPLGFEFKLEEIFTIELIESKMLTKLGLSQVSSITDLNKMIGKYLKDKKDTTFISFLRCLLKSHYLKSSEIEIDLTAIVKKAKQEAKEWEEILKQLKGVI